MDPDMDGTEEERLNIFFKYVQVKKEMVNSAQEILAEAERLGIKNKAPLVLCELLFNDKMCEERQINKYAKLLQCFTHESPEGQKYLISGIEKTVESFEAELLPMVNDIFEELFANNLLEVDVILDWAKEVSEKNFVNLIHYKVAPFIKWLLWKNKQNKLPDLQSLNTASEAGETVMSIVGEILT